MRDNATGTPNSGENEELNRVNLPLLGKYYSERL
jgi:hypothetical protein